jgi:hypothetical protein
VSQPTKISNPTITDDDDDDHDHDHDDHDDDSKRRDMIYMEMTKCRHEQYYLRVRLSGGERVGRTPHL